MASPLDAPEHRGPHAGDAYLLSAEPGATDVSLGDPIPDMQQSPDVTVCQSGAPAPCEPSVHVALAASVPPAVFGAHEGEVTPQHLEQTCPASEEFPVVTDGVPSAALHTLSPNSRVKSAERRPQSPQLHTLSSASRDEAPGGMASMDLEEDVPLLSAEEEKQEASKLWAEAAEKMACENPRHVRLNVSGVPVFFPFPPYRSQHALMHNVVKVARDGGHALVESPTGTGKSMALLCSALAFQQHESIRNAVHNKEVRKRRRSEIADAAELPSPEVEALNAFRSRRGRKLERPQSALSGTEGSAKVLVSNEEVVAASEKTKPHPVHSKPGNASSDKVGSIDERKDTSRPNLPCAALNGGTTDLLKKSRARPGAPEAASEDPDDFVEYKKPRDASWQNKSGAKRIAKKEHEAEPVPANASLPAELRGGRLPEDFDPGRLLDPDEPEESAKSGIWKTPRIFYASRTHAQLAQVVGELHRSGYKPKMTLLAGRGEYCLNSFVKNSRTASERNERCRSNVRDSSCRFYHFQQDLADAMRAENEPFDIEDLNKRGSAMGGCAYYAAVELFKDAELILCPYNYLIDAGIRSSRQISVRGDIVIFDEAHNIEDHARESASFTSDLASFRSACEEVSELELSNRLGLPGSELHRAYQTVQELMQLGAAIGHRIVESGELRPDGDSEVAVFSRDSLLVRLKQAGFTRESLGRFRSALHVIEESKDEDYDTKGRSNDSSRRRRARPAVASPGFFARFGGNDPQHSHDEVEVEEKPRRRRRHGKGRPAVSAMAIAESLVLTLGYTLASPDSFTLAVRRVNNQWESKTEMNLWCLNAAVPFKALSDSARSIIVTSGTLTPIDSFGGELNVKFAVAKSLPHVVDVRKQVFTAVVSSGPGSVQMNTTYSNVANFAWQDSVGTAILSYCTIIPGGVLVFFPSYRLLNNLVKRWKQVGLFEQLEFTKGLVVVEPSGRGAEFADIMSRYAVSANAAGGALMFGVCRGKISEGLDFKDAAARGVLIVGIPYPAAKCPQLVSKRQWNDRERLESSRTDLLSGRAWYDMQAFRALNQAVGRCVRHRHDYGAIILLDQRFRSDFVKRQLPGWVQKSLRPGARSTHEETMLGLTQFFANLEAPDVVMS